MNRKQFVLIILALSIIGGAGLLLLKHKQQSWNVREAKVGQYVFPNFPINDIAAIHVKSGTDFRVLRTNGVWRVPARYDYPANYGRVSQLLIDIKQLKVMQSEIVGQSLRERVELAEPGSGPGAGSLIEFEDAQGKVVSSLLLGKKHDRKQNENEPLGMRGWFDGRYVLIPSEPDNILLVPSELPGAALDPSGWVSTEFFKVENPKFIGLVSPEPDKNWELSREAPTSPWTLNGMKPSETLVRDILARATEIWQWPQFVDVLLDPPTSLTGLDKPTVVTVVTFDNLAYTLKVGKTTPSGKHFITVSVAADLPPERMADPSETPDDKKRLDEEFQKNKKVTEEKLAKERGLSKWVFVADEWLDVVLRDRSQLVQAKTLSEASSK
jgi:hypothetical protein